MNTITKEFMSKIIANQGILDTKTYRYWYVDKSTVKRVRIELLGTTEMLDGVWEHLEVRA